LQPEIITNGTLIMLLAMGSFTMIREEVVAAELSSITNRVPDVTLVTFCPSNVSSTLTKNQKKGKKKEKRKRKGKLVI
jgi:hypothetical protein